MSTVNDQALEARVQRAVTPAAPKAVMVRHGRVVTVAAVALALALGGCAGMSDTQQRTAAGTGIGAAIGAAIGGNQAGSKGVRNGALIGGALAGIGTYIWSRQMEEQRQAMEAATAGTGVQVIQTRENLLQIDIPSDISFDVNKARIQPSFRPILDRFAQTLVANPAATVQIIGHTDSTGNDAINNPLSVNRAAATRDYLVARGVLISRIMIDGRGSHDPIADNGTLLGRARNRRVEIYVGQVADQERTPQHTFQQPGQSHSSGHWGRDVRGGEQDDGYTHTLQ